MALFLHNTVTGLKNKQRLSLMMRTLSRTYQTMYKESYERDAKDVFQSAVSSVLPEAMLKSSLKLNANTLTVAGGRQYELNNNLHIIAVGKAVAGMVRIAEDITQGHLQGGIASIPKGLRASLTKKGRPDLLPSDSSRVQVFEGSPGNIPDKVAMETAQKITDYVRGLSKDDILLTLISGGGSSLLPMPRAPVDIDDMSLLTKLMSRHGATIQDMNIVRSKVEVLKGGGLAREAYPAKVIALILSDVIGDPIESIASGPTYIGGVAPTNRACQDVFRRLGIEQQVPESVNRLLVSKDTVTTDNKQDADINNQIIGSNKIALESAKQKALSLGFKVCTLSHEVEGDVSEVCNAYTSIIEYAVDDNAAKTLQVTPTLTGDTADRLKVAIADAKASKSMLCVLAAGEPTVIVKGKGKGGRNQHLALQVAIETNTLKERNWTFLAAGTDGQDGPTPAAGAFSYALDGDNELLKATSSLEDNDAFTHYTAQSGGRYLVSTGLTGTNVMDIHVFLFDYSQ